MADIFLTNTHARVAKSSLSEVELAHLKSQLTYKDESVAYAIKRASNNFYAAKSIPALQEKLNVKLYTEDSEFLTLPLGLKHILSSNLKVQDDRKLPKFKPMLWLNKPSRDLRYYQREAVDALKRDSRGQAVMATGTGKSLTMLNLVRETGLKTLIVCPSSIIGKQLYKDFSDAFGKKVVGMFGSGKKEVKQVTIGLYQSIVKSIDQFSDFEMVVCDENQTLGANSLVAITRQLGHVPYFYSLSATNWRADGKTPEIYAASGPVVYNFDTKRAIEEGFLAKPTFIVRQVTSYGKDHELKQRNYAEHVVKNDRLTDQIVRDVARARAMSMSVLILVQEIEHGERIAEQLNIPFANGENAESMALIGKLNSGEVPALVAGAQMCGVGVDTVRVDCLVMASFPGTEGLTLQLLGRGLRKYQGKEKVLVLDYWLPNCKMLGRHAQNRVDWYREYGPVKVIRSNDEQL